MRRREFIAGVGAVALGWPPASRAQRAMPIIGVLSVDGQQPFMAAFRKGLAEAGFAEGRNVLIEYRWVEKGEFDRLPAMAKELLDKRVAILFAVPIAPALAAKQATSATPIVFAIGSDPVEMRLVPNLSRPGGNITGGSWLSVELVPKALELLRELVPGLRSIAFLTNPKNPTRAQQLNNMQAGTARLGLKLHTATAAAPGELEDAFAAMTRSRSEALVIGPDPVFTGACKQLAALAARHSLPAVYFTKEFPAAGGLASYGSDANDSFRRAGAYAGRILKGEKPGNLPVIQPTKFELVINLKTAKALGLKISQNMLARTDEVIQ